MSFFKQLGDTVSGKTEKDLQTHQMNLQESYLDFIRDEANKENKGGNYLIYALVLVFVLAVALFFLHKKFKIFSL